MRLILSRHGNTFSPGDTPVWVGRRTDLPLVKKGLEQARGLGHALREAGTSLDAAFCGPLRRTRTHTEIALEEAGLGALLPRIDQRLLEIDYGEWEARSSEDIAAGPGAAELHAWEARSAWPRAAGWTPSERTVADGMAEFVREIGGTFGPAGTVLAVASNGVLRYALRLVPGAFESAVAAGTMKVATGNVCVLEVESGGVRITAWNARPESSLFRLS